MEAFSTALRARRVADRGVAKKVAEKFEGIEDAPAS